MVTKFSIQFSQILHGFENNPSLKIRLIARLMGNT